MKAILSYPRSGNHLVRFFIEFLSEEPTFGVDGNNDDIEIYKNQFITNIPFNIKNYNKEKCYKKYHNFDYNITKSSELIFIIRDPFEVLSHKANTHIDLKEYFNNIDIYKKFQKKKIIFFYENIINNKSKFVNDLYNFLNINNKIKLNYVLKNIDFLYNLSLSGKNRSWNGNNSNNILKYHYNMIPFNTKKIFKKYIIKKSKKYGILKKYI
jgi:hypothetical protein